ncbi:transporter [Actinomycetaceae bacterium TAE3-ERU4]|nr:transporter [Actinomycetaceae bacterium TAE3-ERU4]
MLILASGEDRVFFNFLVAHRLLTIMLVVAAGALVGRVRFGAMRLGAAGALLVGLAVGALDPRLGQDLDLLKTLGVVLFCYTVGLTAGNTFRSDLRRQWPLMFLGIGGLGIMAGAAVIFARWGGLEPSYVTGLYAGTLTSPAIAAALQVSASPAQTLVGYSVSYPVGVLVALFFVSLLTKRRWPGKRDVPSLAEAGLTATSVLVENPSLIANVPGFSDGRVRMSYLRHEGEIGVASPRTQLERGDEVLLVGNPADVAVALRALGRESAPERDLTNYRRNVDFRRFILSNPKLAGRKLKYVREEVRNHLGGVVTRVRRRDLDMLGNDDVVLQLGDRLLVVLPSKNLGEAADFFGDSEARISSIDAFSLGLGVSLGLLAGSVHLPLPGGISLTLGSAAGPLLVGMILGGIHRVKSLHWDLPHSTNSVLRQTGILMFLACLGISSGPAFVSQAFSKTGLVIALVSAGALVLGAAFLIIGAYLVGLSAQRSSGAFAGFVGQPAILSYANSLVNDERIDSAYGALFALGTIVKIVAVQVIVLL